MQVPGNTTCDTLNIIHYVNLCSWSLEHIMNLVLKIIDRTAFDRSPFVLTKTQRIRLLIVWVLRFGLLLISFQSDDQVLEQYTSLFIAYM